MAHSWQVPCKPQDLENVEAQAIVESLEKCDAIAVDEIGPMDLYSEKFKIALTLALESKKLLLAVVHVKPKTR